MVNLKIGANELRFDNLAGIDEHWINQQINGLRKDGHPVCIRVSIDEGPVNLSLVTSDCASSGGGGREPNEDENKIFDLWDELGLNKKDFPSGKFIAFLKQARNIIR
ncbi:MAG TPA: hypothetical protein VK892_22645 [Pyrinomonadaceae bacterium]|nr:hypothetical protein [Pyrinomonadaceae bacterium]